MMKQRSCEGLKIIMKVITNVIMKVTKKVTMKAASYITDLLPFYCFSMR